MLQNQNLNVSKQDKNTYHRNESGTRLVRSGVRSKSKVRVKRKGRQVMNSEADAASQQGYNYYQTGSLNGPSGSRSNYSGSLHGSNAYKTTEVISSKNFMDARSGTHGLTQQRSVQNIRSEYMEVKKSSGSFVTSSKNKRTSGISKTYARLMNGILKKIFNKRIQQAVNNIHEVSHFSICAFFNFFSIRTSI